MEYYQKVKEASEFIRSKVSEEVKKAVILGTGLSKFAENAKAHCEIQYASIPFFS